MLGFVGNTGDAEHTPYHLHFELTAPPRYVAQGLRRRNPTPYHHPLAWQRLSDVAIAGRRRLGRRPTCPPGASAAEGPPGAILLQV